MRKTDFDIIHMHDELSPFGRVIFSIVGTPHIGNFIRGYYLKKTLGKIKNFRKILDVGCGSGNYDFYIKKKYSYPSIDSIDIDGESIKKNRTIAKNYGLKINFIEKDITRLASREKYDLAISIDSLEHIKLMDLAVKKIYLALKRGGHAIIHIPQKNWEEISFLDKRLFREHDLFTKKEHVSANYSLDEFAALLVGVGFKIIESKKSFGYFGKLSWEINQLLQQRRINRLRLLLLPFLKFLGIIDYYFPNRKGSGIFIIARK